MRNTLIVVCATLIFAAAGPRSASAQQDDPQAYLFRAIAILKAKHINRDKVDWTAVEAEALRLSADAQAPADTYPAIRYVIEALGERHSFLLTPQIAQREMQGRDIRSGEATPLAVPEASVKRGVALVTVPGFIGDLSLQKQFAVAGRLAMSEVDASGVCGWIVDLRENSGGNMWPMLNAISGVLGDPPFGAFISSMGLKSAWIVKSGEVVPSQGGPLLDLPSTRLKAANAPLAVLIGPRTASSGEFTAMALRGRPRTVLVGRPSAGLITANAPVRLSDGAVLVVTTGWGEDRTGKRDKDRIYPDIAADDAISSAEDWLHEEGCA